MLSVLAHLSNRPARRSEIVRSWRKSKGTLLFNTYGAPLVRESYPAIPTVAERKVNVMTRRLQQRPFFISRLNCSHVMLRLIHRQPKFDSTVCLYNLDKPLPLEPNRRLVKHTRVITNIRRARCVFAKI